MNSTSPKVKKLNQQKRLNTKEADLNECDIEINEYSETIKKKLSEDKSLHIYDIPFISDSYLFDLLQYIYTKPLKSYNDLLFIQHYLTTFQTLIVTLFKKRQMTDPKRLLAKIALFINFEKLQKGSIICRYGDFGDKFYLIFRGKIAVLITKEIKVKMNQIDYIKHLNLLFQLKEYELVAKTINANLNTYDFKEVSDIKIDTFNVIERNKEVILSSPANKGSKLTESNYDIAPIEEYIKRIIPQETVIPKIKKQYTIEANKEIEELNEITTWIYFQVAKLEESQTFGDVALSDLISKRTATIICLEDSTFGSLTLDIYKKCIKSSQEGIRRMNIESILTNPLFEGISIEVFNKKYFNHFRLVELNLGDCLFIQGNEKTELFFLKEGEIQLLTSSSLNDINNLMEHLGYENKDKDKEAKMQKKSMILKKYFAQIKPNLKLVIYNQRNAIGLDDCMYNNHYFLTAKCRTAKALVYAVEYNFFIQMKTVEKKIERNISSYLPLRKKIMIDRLKHLKDISLFSKLNAMIDDKYPIEDKETDNYNKTNTPMNKNKTSISIFKTAFNKNYNKESLLTENETSSATLLNNILNNKCKIISVHSNQTPSKAIATNQGNENDALSLMNSSSNKKKASCVSNPAYEGSYKNTFRESQYHNWVSSNPQRKALIHLRKKQLNNRSSNDIHIKTGNNICDTAIGQYNGNFKAIKETQIINQIVVDSNPSRNKLLKLQQYLTEGFQSVNSLGNITSGDKRNTSLNQKNEMMFSKIDCLIFDHKLEKSQTHGNKDTINTLKGKKIKIRLPKIKRRFLKQYY